MITIQSLFQGYKLETKRTRITERGELLSYFLEIMNSERRKNGYKEWDIKNIGYFLSLYRTGDLYDLRMKCDRSKNFGSTFNYYVFPKKQN